MSQSSVTPRAFARRSSVDADGSALRPLSTADVWPGVNSANASSCRADSPFASRAARNLSPMLPMATFVTDNTSVVNRDGADVRSYTRAVPTVMERIEEVLASKKFSSAREWSEKAGLSASFINTLRSRWSTGEVRTIRADAAAKLAQAANVSMAWLMGGDVPQSAGGPSYSELDAVLEMYQWPPTLTPEEAEEAVRQLRGERFAAKEPLPQSFWAMRLARIAEVTGRAKTAPKREPVAGVVDLDSESPEVAAHKAARRRR